ncbi:GNAT family N-acetyltransferase [Nocardioides ultimimeridianus]
MTTEVAIEVRAARAEEWRELRELRLRALQDPAASVAFVRSYDEEAAEPDEFWIERATRNAAGEAAYQAVAVDDGRMVGTVVGLLERAGDTDWAGARIEHDGVLVVGVYVDPATRGAGLLGRLVDDVLAWAAGLGLERARLQVHEHNPRAEAAYRKLGFTLTGNSVEIEAGVEREMARLV